MRTRDLACLLALAAGSAGAATYRWVDEGVALLRAGPPDHETVEDTRAVAKSLYDYPTRANPFLTVVTIRGGRAANLARNRKID